MDARVSRIPIASRLPIRDLSTAESGSKNVFSSQYSRAKKLSFCLPLRYIESR